MNHSDKSTSEQNMPSTPEIKGESIGKGLVQLQDSNLQITHEQEEPQYPKSIQKQRYASVREDALFENDHEINPRTYYSKTSSVQLDINERRKMGVVSKGTNQNSLQKPLSLLSSSSVELNKAIFQPNVNNDFSFDQRISVRTVDLRHLQLSDQKQFQKQRGDNTGGGSGRIDQDSGLVRGYHKGGNQFRGRILEEREVLGDKLATERIREMRLPTYGPRIQLQLQQSQQQSSSQTDSQPAVQPGKAEQTDMHQTSRTTESPFQQYPLQECDRKQLQYILYKKQRQHDQLAQAYKQTADQNQLLSHHLSYLQLAFKGHLHQLKLRFNSGLNSCQQPGGNYEQTVRLFRKSSL